MLIILLYHRPTCHLTWNNEVHALYVDSSKHELYCHCHIVQLCFGIMILLNLSTDALLWGLFDTADANKHCNCLPALSTCALLSGQLPWYMICSHYIVLGSSNHELYCHCHIVQLCFGIIVLLNLSTDALFWGLFDTADAKKHCNCLPDLSTCALLSGQLPWYIIPCSVLFCYVWLPHTILVMPINILKFSQPLF